MLEGKKLILIGLNEINFDLVKVYLQGNKDRFSAIHRLISMHEVITNSETEYENLEPWIQWASIHTGLSFEEHKIFRLGDIVNSKKKQIFEVLEDFGYSVGAVSPMNADNRLKNPAYFIPDPWTDTKSDISLSSQMLSTAISQVVNDNSSSKLSFSSALVLGICFIYFSNKRRFLKYFKLAVSSIGKPWRKALFLDLFLHDIHLNKLRSKAPNFSILFLNGGAHIQHHYLFNSLINIEKNYRNPDWYVNKDIDPFIEMLDVYDCIISDYLDSHLYEFIFATGLSQTIYDRVKFYYRLNNHKKFLNLLGIKFQNVYPRMTRDFLISFESHEDALKALIKLQGIKVNDDQFFGEIEIRTKELFVTLSYSKEINIYSHINFGMVKIDLLNHVSFVAIKNGMHQAKGFIYSSSGLKPLLQKSEMNVRDLYKTIKNYFIDF